MKIKICPTCRKKVGIDDFGTLYDKDFTSFMGQVWKQHKCKIGIEERVREFVRK